ncbi:hypothetical protein BDV18DRAFT_128523 [Aspergillus unguis]
MVQLGLKLAESELAWSNRTLPGQAVACSYEQILRLGLEAPENLTGFGAADWST